MVSITSATVFDQIEEHPNFFFGSSKDNKTRDMPSYKEDHPVGISLTETAHVTKLMGGDDEQKHSTFPEQKTFDDQEFSKTRRMAPEDQHGAPHATVNDTVGPVPPQSMSSKAQNFMPREPEINDMDEHSPKGRRGSDVDRLYRNSNLMHGVAGVFTE